MVCFAPDLAPYHLPRWSSGVPLLVREAVPPADSYRTEAAGAASTELSQAEPTSSSFEDSVSLEELEEEIATLAAHIHAATHRLLSLIAGFDRRGGWNQGGHRSCAHWLHARTGIDLGAAREKVRTARALEALPKTSASMARGELSFSKVRALSRVATPANESELLELARGCTTSQLERMVRGFRKGNRTDEEAMERERHERRTLSVFPGEGGMYVVRGQLTPEVGALLMRAVEAASDALYREEGELELEDGTLVSAETSGAKATRRRADALGLLAERALSVGFGNGSKGDGGKNKTPISGTRAERYQVVLHVDAETLEAQGEPGRSELEDGTRVSAETSRRISCDTGLVRIRHAPDGSINEAGRRTRTVSPALRRALEARDRGCRFPGCGLRFTEGHHVKHWADGGETTLGNTLLLCRHHHRLVHEGGWNVSWWGPGKAVFFDPRGGTHFDGRWQLPEIGDDPAGDLVKMNRLRGVHPTEWTASAQWKHEDDIPDRIYFRALEAMGEARP